MQVPFVSNLKNLKVPSICSDELTSFHDVSTANVTAVSNISIASVSDVINATTAEVTGMLRFPLFPVMNSPLSVMMDVMMMMTKAVVMKGESNGEGKSSEKEMMDTPPMVMIPIVRK